MAPTSTTQAVHQLIAEGIAAARTITAAADVNSWLAKRWEVLKAERVVTRIPGRIVVHPWLKPETQADAPSAPSCEFVATGAIAEIDQFGVNGGQWGVVNNGPDVFADMLRRLLDAHQTGRWTQWAEKWATSPLSLSSSEGFGQELYKVSDGRHRTMMAAALGLAHLPASVYRSRAIVPGAVMAFDTHAAGFDEKHLRAMAAAGEIKLEPSNGAGALEGTALRMPPAHWWFDAPDDVVAQTRAFSAIYPLVAVPSEMLHRDEWIRRFAPKRGGRWARLSGRRRGA